DRLELTADEFLERLRAGVDASTSQPAPQAFRDAYADALRGAETVVAVVVSRPLSGTWANAEAAARAVGDGRVTVVDSRSASLGEGLLVLRGLELARAGWTPEAIARELVRVRDQSAGYFAVDNFERLVRSGRVGRVVAWLGTRLNVKPVMTISAKGTVEPAGRVRGKGEARRRVLALLEAALGARHPAELRIGVVHCGAPAFAEHVRGMAEHLVEALAPSGGRPHHVEGLAQGRWVLLDYVDFVVHLFHPELRAFYELERLWGDAPVVAVGHPELKG